MSHHDRQAWIAAPGDEAAEKVLPSHAGPWLRVDSGRCQRDVEDDGMNVAMLLSCASFEGFFGSVQGQTRQSYLESYRHDWAWYYARGLLENGVKPTLYLPALYESGRYTTDWGVAVRFLPLERWYRIFEGKWRKRMIRSSRWTLYADERLNAIAIMETLRQGLAEDRIDLLYIQEYWSGRFDHLVNRVHLPVLGADHGGLSKRVVKAFKQQAFRKAVACSCQTQDECRIVERYQGRPIFQPNGCDSSEFSPDPDRPRGKTILTVTRLTNKQKRTSDLIRAMAHLPEEWTLDIVGTGPDKAMLEKLAARLGLSSRTRFHGFVGRHKVRDFLRSCGVYAMPSANEAVALAVLEAMGCGAAVVLSRIRAFEELVRDGVNGRLVSVGDVAGLAVGITDAWTHRDVWGLAASETVRSRYDTRILYRNLADFIRAVVPARSADTLL